MTLASTLPITGFETQDYYEKAMDTPSAFPSSNGTQTWGGGWTVTTDPTNPLSRFNGGVALGVSPQTGMTGTTGINYAYFKSQAPPNTIRRVMGIEQVVIPATPGIVPGMLYTLKVDYAYKSGAWDPATVFKIMLLKDGVPVAGDVSLTPPYNNFSKTTSAAYKTLAGDEGKALSIKIYLNSMATTTLAQQPCFDNVRLDVLDVRYNAWNPSPDGTVDVNVTVNGNNAPPLAKLTWNKGELLTAPTHKLYLSADADLPASTLAYEGTAVEFTPAQLKYSTKYYWRVDEINGATTYTGSTWSFTTVGAKCVDNLKLTGDATGDCVVNFEDLRRITDAWLDCTRSSDPCPGM